MADGWNVKRTVCCARCGSDIEFSLWKPADVTYQVMGVEGMRFDVFDVDGEGMLAEEEYEPIPLCNECYAALEKWLGIGDEDD